jgi:hypothetical protein
LLTALVDISPSSRKAIEPVLGADSALPDVDKAVDKAGKGR